MSTVMVPTYVPPSSSSGSLRSPDGTSLIPKIFASAIVVWLRGD